MNKREIKGREGVRRVGGCGDGYREDREVERDREEKLVGFGL